MQSYCKAKLNKGNKKIKKTTPIWVYEIRDIIVTYSGLLGNWYTALRKKCPYSELF